MNNKMKLLNRINNSPYLLLLIPPLLWGGNIVLARGVNTIIPPTGLAFWRWTVALIFLLPFTWKYAKRDWTIAVQHWKILSILAVLGISTFNTMLYRAVHTTTAINGSLIQSTMPAIIIFITLFLFKERISKVQVFGVSVSVLGAFYIVIHGSWEALIELSFVEGDIWMFAAVILYAFYTALLRKRPKLHDFSFLTYTFALGIIGLLPFYLWELSFSPPIELSWKVLSSILYVALFPSIIAYLCWNRGIALIGANRAGLFIHFVPVFASILAIFLLNESFQIFHLIGMFLIIGGMFLFNRKQKQN